MLILQVTLSSSGNHDYQEGESRRDLDIEPETIEVESLEQAREACQAFITENGLGGGNWTGGQVHDGNGSQVAQVSYNGNVWES